jgi:hypothetical protein
VLLGVLDFIDANGVDLAERPVFQTPGYDMFYSVEDLVPGCAKGFRRLFPMTVAAPNGLGRAFTVAPWNFFDSHRAAATIDAPHGAHKEDEKPPQGSEPKASFGEFVVPGKRNTLRV